MRLKFYILCLVTAVWTIVQTSFHLVFLFHVYFMSICKITPKDLNSIFFYLTYLYNKECSTPKYPQPNTATTSVPEKYVFFVMDFINTPNHTATLEQLVPELLSRIEYFPVHGGQASRTSVFILCMLILDGSWIVSAVSLFMGTCCRIKQTLALVFYGPWLILTICVLIFDVTLSAFFGIDISETTNFSDWLDFVQVTNKSAFPDYYFKSFPPLTMIPSLTLTAISSRFVVIWLSNLILFFIVMRATISVYHESYKSESPNRTFLESPIHHTRANLDTSAARIRNWQLFYGAVDASTSHSVESGDKDLNSNSKGTEVNSCGSDSNGSYFAYTDVAENCLDELRGQLPWSYIPAIKEEGNKEEKIELGHVQFVRKHQRTNSVDSLASGTEL